MTDTDTRIHPVILSGGSGTRLWPLSRRARPKQFQAVADARLSLFQQTILRAADAALFAAPIVVGHEDHRFLMAEQLEAVNVKADICLEPQGRNTAAAVICAALRVQAQGGAYMLVLPSDHAIGDTASLLDAVRASRPQLEAGRMILFGIAPAGPETGYGYIEYTPDAQDAAAGPVVSFREKPDAATAAALVRNPHILWNSGMFLLPVDAFLADMRGIDAALVAACEAAIAQGHDDLSFFRFGAQAYASIPSLPIDKAFFEKTHNAYMRRADFDWSDIGAWDSVGARMDKDMAGNALQGPVYTHDTRNSIVRSDGPLVAVSGLEDVVVVAARDAILVSDRKQMQSVRQLVDRLLADGRREAHAHPVMYRPWGHFEELYDVPFCRIIRIFIKPGGRLTLQRHHHRSEHWIVIEGQLRVTLGEDAHIIHPGQSVFAGPETPHRLENPGDAPVEFIEVQVGTDLSYSDVTRLDEVYG